MKTFIAGLIFMTLLLLSCGPNVKFAQEGANFFGEKITSEGARPVGVIAKEVNSQDTIQVLVEGTINEVCKAKGCWMTLENEGDDNPVFIRFKDYAFFVPKDAGGKKAIVQGKLYTTITSVEELQHFAEDKGQSAEQIAAITAPKRELQMMADGVIIYNN